MKKILFINPTINTTVFGKMKMLALPPMGLGVLASRTPAKYDVSIIDENVESIDFNTDADLVAVTATTTQAPRAYEILSEFKRRGIPTIIGGIHASVMFPYYFSNSRMREYLSFYIVKSKFLFNH